MTEQSSPGFLTLSDLEDAASRKASSTAWAYVQGGAGEECTLRANRQAFQRRTLRPRVLVDVKTVDLGTKLLDEKVSVPFYVSPMAYQGLLHPEAEAGTARAASHSNALAVFSTVSTLSMETIAQSALGVLDGFNSTSSRTGPSPRSLWNEPRTHGTRLL